MAAQWLSHWTQVFQNYFDEADTRARQSKYSVEAQLLNTAAQQIEQSALRLNREHRSKFITDCPANIDNGGCYTKQSLPLTFDYLKSQHTVSGLINGNYTNLVAYDDTLPVPVGATLDLTQQPKYLPSSKVFTLNGIGDAQLQAWSTQRLVVPVLAFPGRLQFWLSGDVLNFRLKVRIVGAKANTSAWQKEHVTTSETIIVSSLGSFQSKFSWLFIENLEVQGLPVGSTLTGYCGSFETPAVIDRSRPYTSSEDREVLYDRYWSVDNGFLFEQYMRSNYQGLEYVQSYQFPNASCLAIEPNTNGIFVGSGTTLYYGDRREPLPTSLDKAGLNVEPYYGLQVLLDEARLGSLRYLLLRPEPYQSKTVSRYRYKITTPDGSSYALTPNGTLATLDANAGWRFGQPIPLTIPLADLGTYVITLECSGIKGNIEDRVIYNNLSFNPLAEIDLSSIVPNIAGLSFDDRNRLWVWTGTYAVPINLQYNAYLIDESTASIYLTDPVNGLVIDGFTI